MEISERIPVKVSWTVFSAIIAIVFGFAAWMTTMEIRAQDHTEKLSVLESIDKRLFRIELLLEEKKGGRNE